MTTIRRLSAAEQAYIDDLRARGPEGEELARRILNGEDLTQPPRPPGPPAVVVSTGIGPTALAPAGGAVAGVVAGYGMARLGGLRMPFLWAAAGGVAGYFAANMLDLGVSGG